MENTNASIEKFQGFDVFLAKVKLKNGEFVRIRFLQLNDLLSLDRMFTSLSEQTKFFFHPPLFKGNLFFRLFAKFKFIISCFPMFRRLLLKFFPRVIVIPIVAVNKNEEIIGLSYLNVLNWLPRATYFGVASCIVTDKYQEKGLGYQLIMFINNVAHSYSISEIYAHVLAINKRALSVLLKLGYRLVSRYKVLSKYKGEYVDECQLVYKVKSNRQMF